MNTHYPHHHVSHHDLVSNVVRPICTYCLHLLGAAGVPLSAAMRRAIVDDHVCVEKVIARQPHVALPFN